MEAPILIKEYSTARALRLFTRIPDGHKAVKVRRPSPGSLYSRGMYVVVNPAQTELVEGAEMARVVAGGPLDAGNQVVTVSGLRRAFGGWCLAPGGHGHSLIAGSVVPVTLLDGPMNEDGLRKSILGRVVGYLGEHDGRPINDLWDDTERRLHPSAMDQGDLPQKYTCIASGGCLEPIFHHGDRLEFSATDAVSPGDYVGLILKPIHAYEGMFQFMVKRLVTPLPVGPFPLPDYMPAPPVVLVEALNPVKTYTVPFDRLMAVHRCNGIYNGAEWKASRQQMRSLVAAQRAAAGGAQ